MAGVRNLNIIILTNSNFPIGMASTNRLVSYCRGIVELGHSIKVIVLCPHEKENEPIVNKELSGIYKGIEFQYASHSTIWPNNVLSRIKTIITGLFLSMGIVFKINKKNKIDVLLFAGGTTKFLYVIPFFLLSRLIGTKLIREKNEYPVFELKSNQYSKVYKFFARRFLFRFFDGMLIMTYPLMNYFRQITRKDAKIEIIPMTVEPDRFISVTPNNGVAKKYIAYTGTICGEKDGVDILVNSFRLIADKYKDIDLVLIGDTSNKSEFNKLINNIERFGLSKRIIFTGKIHRDYIPHYLCNATVLVLSRPVSLQAKGGFPTKLGEYLATGKPIVVTKVGDIPVYLKDKENAYLAEPGNIEAFAYKLDEVLSFPEQAIMVGMEGKRLAEGVFNYLTQAKRIVAYINQLLEC